MSIILKYKGYEGSAEIDLDRGVCRGRILFVNDLVTFESDSAKDLEAEFKAAVDDYLETCAQLDRQPQKPYTGQFNVRVGPDLHRSAKRRAILDNTTLNDVVSCALRCYIQKPTEVMNNNFVVIGDAAERMLVSATAEDWQNGVTTSVRTH